MRTIQMKGPILVRKGFSVAQSVPFDTENANVFLNGVASTLESVKLSQKDAGFAVIYYNVKSKTIWAYTTSAWDQDDSSGNNSYVLLKGEIKNIYYKSTELQYLFSIYGQLEVGDEVVLVCNESNGSYTAVDAIEY